ncbi:Glyoxylate/hydroxypyruvate reductase (D-isomer-specific 2-hydroxy acid dehydrogenase superfamily) [Handroanthus impetiginosus]|uniref:Glyoxylate/hydroxypyruvate reductase (D-isomer-specific 2-hydroxy acid dehydrogenase superfamily) n=1 Tax=Handroanthus impetiginosus TaxID=429701 RepID=A0A2G9GGI7_9LAMI|nr:Glyoxylate/hydroxypyruvate reductase (D-isomer-specific 2-hydroxy acid dehydrogenase superfamily) [Handroanthus impetiginosus]
MAEGQQTSPAPLLREIIVFGPPYMFIKYEKQFSSRYRILRPWESPIPLAQFLETHAQNTQAALITSFVSLSAAVLRNLPALRLILTTSAGVDHIDIIECRRRGIAVVYAAAMFSADVADLAVGLLLDVLRKISAGNRFVKNGDWAKQGDYPLGFKLGGKKVGIVGLGNIGIEVAKRLEAFGCEVSYYSRNRKPSVSYVFYPDISELAAKSDILVVCCALTEQTHHIINRDILLALGKKGVIVNIARGAVIDEKELVHFLQQGDIAGAGLEVFENEPFAPKELFELDNVVLSPHVANFTEESFRDLYELVSENLEAFFANKPLRSLVSEE